MSRPADPNAKIDLLRAAEAVFCEHGLDAAKVEDITDRAKRSKGAFYLHFESKEDAFRQIVESFLARLSTICEESTAILQQEINPEDPESIFDQSVNNDVMIFDFLWQNRGVVRLMLDGGKSATFSYLIEEFAERTQKFTKDFLRWGVAQGLYRDGLDVEVAGDCISGAYDRVARQLVRLERKPDLHEIFSEVQRFLLAGVGSKALASVIDFRVNDSPVKKARKAQGRR